MATISDKSKELMRSVLGFGESDFAALEKVNDPDNQNTDRFNNILPKLLQTINKLKTKTDVHSHIESIRDTLVSMVLPQKKEVNGETKEVLTPSKNAFSTLNSKKGELDRIVRDIAMGRTADLDFDPKEVERKKRAEIRKKSRGGKLNPDDKKTDDEALLTLAADVIKSAADDEKRDKAAAEKSAADAKAKEAFENKLKFAHSNIDDLDKELVAHAEELATGGNIEDAIRALDVAIEGYELSDFMSGKQLDEDTLNASFKNRITSIFEEEDDPKTKALNRDALNKQIEALKAEMLQRENRIREDKMRIKDIRTELPALVKKARDI